MAMFPRRDADKVQLATDLVAGMRANPELFRGCPVTADQLEESAARLSAAATRKTEAKASAVGATAEKRKEQKQRDIRMKQVIRHVENVVQGDAGKLQTVGWGARRPRGRRVGSVPPGQVTVLEVAGEGRDWVALRWKAPANGGLVAAYRVERKQGDGDWTYLAASTQCEVTLLNQPLGIAFLYQIVAINDAGEGTPSNVVRVVL